MPNPHTHTTSDQVASSMSSQDVSRDAKQSKLTKHATPRWLFWLMVVAIVLLATNMRAPLIALGAIAPILQDSLDISAVQVGWLGATPMLLFTLGALVAPIVGRRFGLERTLIAALVVLIIGIIMRSVWLSWWGFLIGTVVLSFAIAFLNILIAPIIKTRTPHHIPVMTAVFSLTMSVMAGLMSAIIYPLSERFGWPWALGSWSLIGLLAVSLWVIIHIKVPLSLSTPTSAPDVALPVASNQDTDRSERPAVSVWRTPLAWQMAIAMGMQSLMFYTVASFLPSIWISKGLSQAQGGLMGAVFQFMAPFAIILMTFLIRRGMRIQILAVGASLINVTGIVGITYLSPNLALLWSGLMGFGCAVIFTLSLILFSIRTYTPNEASRLSGMVQTIAYLIAFCGPFGAGWLHEQTHSWHASLLFILITTLLNVGVVWLASRPIMIDGRPA